MVRRRGRLHAAVPRRVLRLLEPCNAPLAFLALVAGLLGQATRRGAGAPAVVARIVQAAALGVFLLAIGAAVWDLTRIADYGSAGFFVAEAVSNLLVGVGGVALTTVILARPSIRGPGRGETLRDHE